MDKEFSNSKLGIIDASSVIEDFRNAGIQILDVRDEIYGLFEVLRVKVNLHKNYFKTEVRKFANTKSYRYLW
jgi:hypothetical protein